MEDYTEVFVWGSDHFGQLGLASKQHKTYTMPRFCSFNVLIKSISCGDQHSGFISSQGHVYTMGSNLEGRLGISDQSVRFSASPCLVESLRGEDCKQISCGGGHSLVVTVDGAVYSWGFGESGALGLGTLQTQWSPVGVKLPSLYRACEASCGAKHSAILARGRDPGNTVLVSGLGDSGQLGTGKREKETSFVGIRVGEECVQVSCGVFHTGFLTVTGKVYVTGGNAFGQLGLGNKKGTCIPRKVDALDMYRVGKIGCSSHSAALTENGEVFVWGTGIFGEYVLPHKVMSRAKDICVGGNFTLVLDEQENLYAWGNNLNGELGVGDFDARNSPSQVTSLQGKRVKALACGSNFVLTLGEDIRYQSTKHKSSTPLRQAAKESEIPIHDSPKPYDSVQYRSSRVLSKKNVYEPQSVEKPVQEKRIIEENRSFEMYMREFERYKDENLKVSVELEREQKRSKNLTQENEELRRMNELLRSNENRAQQEHLVGQSQLLEVQRLRMLLEESKHNAISLEIENKALKEEMIRAGDSLKAQEREFMEMLRMKLANQETQMLDVQHKMRTEIEANLDSYEAQLKQMENNLSLTISHKKRLEDALSVSSTQISELESQLSSSELRLRDTESSLSQSNSHKAHLEETVRNNSVRISDLSNQLQRSDQDIQRLKSELSQTLSQKERIEHKLDTTNLNNSDIIQSLERELQKLKSDLSQSHSQRERLENKLDSSSEQNSDLLQKVSIYEKELQRLNSDLSQSHSQREKLEQTLNSSNLQNSELHDKLSASERENAWIKSDLSNANSQKNKLEELYLASCTQNSNLSDQVAALKSAQSSLEASKIELMQNFEALSQENNDLRLETLEKEAQRDHMVKLIEEKMQELETDRCSLMSERDNLNRAVSDLTFEISKLNQNLRESNHNIMILEDQLAQEMNKTSRLMIDLETANEEIVLLELKNTEIFENLQKELAQRAKDYKDRTLTLLSTPSRNIGRSSLADQSVNFSPTRETMKSPESVARSPIKETVVREGRSPTKEGFGYSTMPSIDLIGRTPNRGTSLSRSQQERISAAAMKLLRNTESPLRNIRVSSPSRRSPHRPAPYRAYY